MEQATIHFYPYFQWVLSTSVMASIMVGLILLSKVLLKDKLNIRWHYLLWILLMARLILPWTLESSFSIYNLVDLNRGVSHQTSYSENTSFSNINPIPNYTIESEPDMSSSNQVSSETKGIDKNFLLFSIIVLAWLIGILSIALYIYVNFKKFDRKINAGSLITDQRIQHIFYQCKKAMHIQKDIPLIMTNVIQSPTLYGSIRPRLLLPSNIFTMLTNDELKYIFFHELSHYRRKDIAVNWLMTLLLIIHWFNPILWYAYNRMREDQEMACDALALTFIDQNESIQYGHTIIKLTENYAKFMSNPRIANFSGNKSQMYRRIERIKMSKKVSYTWSGLTFAIVLFISGCTLTSANHSDMEIVSVSSIAPDEFIILDKFTVDDDYYVKFRFESKYYFDKYNIKNNIRTYKVADQALYNVIDLKHTHAYPGFTIKSVVNPAEISEEEARKFKIDPQILISNQSYSKFNTIISIGQKSDWEVRNEYVENNEVLFSVFPDPQLSAGKPYGYMFSFTEPFEAKH